MILYKMRRTLGQIFKKISVLALACCIWTTAAHAAPMTGHPSCDFNYWESLKSRAWLEAQREIMQNQNLIFKPDSILEYTCFDHALGTWIPEVGAIFSEVPPLSASIGAHVLTKTSEYIETNFGHEFLGGRFPEIIEGAPDPVSEPCNVMAAVWEKAKCMNFWEPPFDWDGFYTFLDWSALPDPRAYPPDMWCADGAPGGALGEGYWIEQLQIATNIENVDTGAEPKIDYPPLLIPMRESYNENFEDILELLLPEGCPGEILTGVTVRTIPGATETGYLDGICTNPGCTWTAGESCTEG